MNAGRTYGRLYPPPGPDLLSVSAVAGLHEVAAASGVLGLAGQSVTFPRSSGSGGLALPQLRLSLFSVDGIDNGHTPVGPLSAATISFDHMFAGADADADVAVVDSGYVTCSNLRVGSAITIKQVRFTVIGIVAQPQGTSPSAVYSRS